MLQLDFFESSSSPPSAPSSILPIIGLRVQTSQDCRACGSNVATIGSSAGPHAARLNCSECGIHRGWMSAREAAFIAKIVSMFGCPTTPIVVREWRHV